MSHLLRFVKFSFSVTRLMPYYVETGRSRPPNPGSFRITLMLQWNFLQWKNFVMCTISCRNLFVLFASFMFFTYFGCFFFFCWIIPIVDDDQCGYTSWSWERGLKKMGKKKPATSLEFLKAQAIWFVGMEIWRFSHLTQIW